MGRGAAPPRQRRCARTWHSTSMPSSACGMASCCTAGGRQRGSSAGGRGLVEQSRRKGGEEETRQHKDTGRRAGCRSTAHLEQAAGVEPARAPQPLPPPHRLRCHCTGLPLHCTAPLSSCRVPCGHALGRQACWRRGMPLQPDRRQAGGADWLAAWHGPEAAMQPAAVATARTVTAAAAAAASASDGADAVVAPKVSEARVGHANHRSCCDHPRGSASVEAEAVRREPVTPPVALGTAAARHRWRRQEAPSTPPAPAAGYLMARSRSAPRHHQQLPTATATALHSNARPKDPPPCRKYLRSGARSRSRRWRGAARA